MIGDGCTRYFKCPNICLVVAQALVLSRVFGSQLYGHTRSLSHINHDLVDAFGMHIDLYLSPAPGDRFEKSLPEWITPFRNTALTMDTKSKSLNLRTLLQKNRKSIA